MNTVLRPAFLLSLGVAALAGCGGGGTATPTANPFVGTYAGSFTDAAASPLPAQTPFQAPSSGSATSVVESDGTFSIQVGEGSRFYGTLDAEGQTHDAHFEFAEPNGTITYPASATFSGFLLKYRVSATLLVDVSVDSTIKQTPVDYVVSLTRQG